MTIIWCMVSDIWSPTDRLFCHSGPAFALLSHYGPAKSKFLKKWKTPEDFIILQMFTINDSRMIMKNITLHKCAINDNHMMYGSWDMKHDRQKFLSLRTVFCPFTSLRTQKIRILKNWENHLELSSFYTSVPKIMIICFTLP